MEPSQMFIDRVGSDSDEEIPWAERGSSLDISRQNLEHLIRKRLDELPKGRRKVFEPFRFDSDHHQKEVEISVIIRTYNEIPTGALEERLRTNSAWRFHAKGLLQFSTDMNNELVIEKIKDVQKRWIDTQSVFRIKRRYITRDTFNRCQDMVRQILLHLSLYARALTEKDQVRRATGMLLIQTLGTPFARPDLEDKKTPGQRKHREGQDSFRSRLVSYYNCQNGDKIWCPVLREWTLKKQCTAAHIVPYSFPPHILKTMLLPEDPEEMVDDLSEPSMVPQNGLYLYGPIEDALDDGKLVIVPRQNGSDHIDFKVHLLDESLQTNATFEFNGLQIPWRTLDGKSLQFQNRNRPAKHFLYLHILLTVVRKCIYQPPGWAYRLTDFIDVKEAVVLTPRPHLIDGPFKRLSKLITDVAVFEQVQATIPMAPTILPDSYSVQNIKETSEELDIFTADMYALLRTDSEGDDDLSGPLG